LNPKATTQSTAPANTSENSPKWLARNGSTLLVSILVVLAFWYFLRDSDAPLDDAFNVFKVIIGLGLVIFIHELGHFLAAKSCGVYVETFSIGFGTPLFGVAQMKWGETLYKIGWIPLGGYVKMLGEGENNSDDPDNPRSYKNKSVPQRMLIISAGVIMNLILAWVCYLGVLMTRGIEHDPGIIGTVAPGGPAWQTGLRPGDLIRVIGSRTDPVYKELQREVMRAGKGTALNLRYVRFAEGRGEELETQITPTRSDEVLAPMLLIRSSRVPVLIRRIGRLSAPVEPNSPASHAEPPLQFGDRIIGATDPDNPSQITELRPDPRRAGEDRRDYFDLERRLQRLMGQPITLRVRRAGATGPIDVIVPPAWGRTVGLRMLPGPIVALRKDSPAAQAGLIVQEGKSAGDVLDAIELTKANGQRVRYSVHVAPGSGDLPLDPVRLPTQLALWAAEKPADYTVRVTVLRTEGHSAVPKTFEMKWDRSWELIDSSPADIWPVDTPLSLSGLGLAYRVKNQVAGVDPNSPAEKAGLKPGDVIKRLTLTIEDPKGVKVETRRELADDQWSYYGAFLAQNTRISQVRLKLQNEQEISLIPEEDRTLPLVDRGLIFDGDKSLQKADGLVNGLYLASRSVWISSMTIYENLIGLVRGRLSMKAISGPITIAKHSFDLAGRDTFEFILFIALINVNLAIVNFLPIPVLDGGHMVFLLYEAIRRKPPSDSWRFALTIVGLIAVLSLMFWGLALDFGRHLLEPLERLFSR
jgi:regulator of sigma E protease